MTAGRSGWWTSAVVLLLVVALAASLRFRALDFGQDVVDARPDEMGVVLALDGIHQGRPFPMFFAYGGGYHSPLYAFVRLWGALSWSDDLSSMVRREPHRAFVAARAWSALLSTLTVLVTYAIGRSIGGRPAGLLAAALLACSPLAIREAHFAKADAAAAFVAALSCLVLASPPASLIGRALLTGAVSGLALSTKYLFAFAALPLLALERDLGWTLRAGRWRPLVLALVVVVGVFVALAPVWLGAPRLGLDFTRAIAASQQDYPGLPYFRGWRTAPLVFHATVSLRYGAGLLVALLTVPALLRALRHSGPTRLIAIAILAHWLVLLTNPLTVARNLLPALPGTLVLVADLVCAMLLRSSGGARRGLLVAVAVGAVLIVEPLRDGVRLVRLLGEPDTRALAARWIAEHVPRDARVATWGAPAGAADFGAPALDGRAAPRGLDPRQWRDARVDYVVRHSYPLPFSSATEPPGWPEMRSVAVFDPFDGPVDRPVLEPLDAFYLPLARFGGVRRPGPRIEIFALHGNAP